MKAVRTATILVAMMITFTAAGCVEAPVQEEGLGTETLTLESQRNNRGEVVERPALTCDTVLCIEGYHCEEGREGPQCVEDPDCADRCAQTGGSRARIQACIDTYCGDDSCSSRCNSLGRADHASCLRRGGEARRCQRLAQETVARCHRQNCQGN